MSQPCRIHATVPQPGKVDPDLKEFWVGNPWEIFQKENLSCFERNKFLMNARGQSFLDASFVSGADHDGDSRSVIAVDFNHDGRQDLLLRQSGGGPLIAYENRFGRGNAVTVQLRGVKSNRAGIGARLVGKVADRSIVREYFPSNGFRSQSVLPVSFGLGTAEKLDELTVQWPSGLEQTFQDLPAGQHVVLTEGADSFELARLGEPIVP